MLRDGFALTAMGDYASFRDIAEALLRELFAGLRGWDGDPGVAADYVLAGFAALDVHADVPGGVRRLHRAGLRLATLTNGAAALTEQLLTRAGVREHFEALLDVNAPRRWKPAAGAYRYALGALDAEPAETLLVAVHPWDVAGARRAGLQAAWLRRGAGGYPAVLGEPTIIAADVRDLAHLLTGS